MDEPIEPRPGTFVAYGPDGRVVAVELTREDAKEQARAAGVRAPHVVPAPTSSNDERPAPMPDTPAR